MRFELGDWGSVGCERKRVHKLKTHGQPPQIPPQSREARRHPEGLAVGGRAGLCGLFAADSPLQIGEDLVEALKVGQPAHGCT